jgi:Flp pilus assembly protein TadD
MLSACAGSGLELAALSTADPASGSAASSTSSGSIETGALPPVAEGASRSKEVRTVSEKLTPAIAKARQLRTNGDLKGAMDTLTTAAEASPTDTGLMRERGLLALEMGQIDEAKGLLKKADSSSAPDWRIKSALGSAYAASGDQPAAQKEFAAALTLAPDHPSILNNLALSYALDGKHEQAEKLLRRAATSKGAATKARQNLALLLGLSGNIDEARHVSEAALPAEQANANISYLERLKSGAKTSRVERNKPDDDAATTTIGAMTPGN